MSFNKLTARQTEALALLSEECAETIQIIGKILRHGIESCHPDTTECNRDLLMSELGDVRAAEEIAIRVLELDEEQIESARDSKLERVRQYLHHIKLP